MRKPFSKFLWQFLPLSALMVLSACAIDEPIKKAELLEQSLPGVTLPEKYKNSSAHPNNLLSTSSTASIAWLASFNDPELSELAKLALQSAPDLRVFAARREQAEAMMKAVGGSFYPNVGAQGKTGSKMGMDGSGTSGYYIGANFGNWIYGVALEPVTLALNKMPWLLQQIKNLPNCLIWRTWLKPCGRQEY